MKNMLTVLLILPGVCGPNLPARACGDHAQIPLSRLASLAISDDANASQAAVASLRATGPAGLEALATAHAELIRQHSASQPSFARGPDEQWHRLRRALDAVGKQRDCHSTLLFWHTDFDQAQAAARASGKPILSLRLLGNLDEEFSCANSRFFRTTLYANQEVSRYLRDHFILHWKSVRAVPRVTIDFGDGRRLERTLTGNSIHYVLSADGRVIDALPGLYGTKAFRHGLKRAEDLARRYENTRPDLRGTLLASYHRERMAVLNAELTADLQKISANVPGFSPASTGAPPPSAQTAARLAISKGRIETPLLRQTAPQDPAGGGASQGGIDDATWKKLAVLHESDSRLDASSTALIRTKHPAASDAGRIAATKRVVEDPLLRQIRNLERSISEDTARNEYLLHPRIHAWLAAGDWPDADALNRKIYAELFLTPDSDPWLGLRSDDTFAALDGDGLSVPPRSPKH